MYTLYRILVILVGKIYRCDKARPVLSFIIISPLVDEANFHFMLYNILQN